LVQAAPHFHLLLTAVSEDEFERSVELWVNKATYIMSRVKQFDANGNYSTYEVTALKTDAPQSEQDFKMSVPEGYEAVDLR
jgi:outer membrane lipoprotein-sorting protein